MSGPQGRLAFVVLAVLLPSSLSAGTGKPMPHWAGHGSYRVQVTVPPASISRARDERPARVKLDFRQILGELGVAGRVDLATLQVIRYSAKTGKPFSSDWDDDGDFDLIVAREPRGTPIYYENIGARRRPRLTDRGGLQVGGAEIQVPFLPCPEAPYMKREYTSVPEVVDWDGDGDKDLLLGGYLTGFIFFYENTGGSRQFSLARGNQFELQDGSVLRVGKIGISEQTPDSFESHSGDRSVLAPGDYNGDGKNDLMVADAHGDLYFFPNRGSNRRPVFGAGQLIIPGNGSRAWVGSCDWNGDKLLDLIFGRGVDHLLLNEGSTTEPKFTFDASKAIPRMPWIPYPFPYPVDWNRDGDVDLIITSSYCHLYFMDHSFVDFGYGEAKVTGMEKRR